MGWVITTCDARANGPARVANYHRVRELMIARAQPGLHQVCEQYAYLEEKRFEAWSAHLRRMLQPPTGGNVVDLHRQTHRSFSACPKVPADRTLTDSANQREPQTGMPP
jgi:hypothetical protein